MDRLRDLLGPSISFRDAASRGLARRAGELAGESCGRFGFHVDLAPVVDRRIEGASAEVLRDRCAGEDPAVVARAAREFLDGAPFARRRRLSETLSRARPRRARHARLAAAGAGRTRRNARAISSPSGAHSRALAPS